MCILITGRKIGGDFVSITATELKMNLGKYLLPYQDRVDVAKSLFGIIPDEMTLEEAREERLGRI